MKNRNIKNAKNTKTAKNPATMPDFEEPQRCEHRQRYLPGADNGYVPRVLTTPRHTAGNPEGNTPQI